MGLCFVKEVVLENYSYLQINGVEKATYLEMFYGCSKQIQVKITVVTCLIDT